MAKQTALQYYDDVLKRLEAYQGDVAEAYKFLPREGMADLQELTSGGVSSKTLRKMGHPYARNAPTIDAAGVKTLSATRRGVSKGYAKRNALKASAARAAAPLLPINRQKGNLNRAIRSRKLPATGGNARYRVYFDRAIAGNSMYAILPRGTRKVVPRGLHTEQRRRWRIRNRAFRATFSATTRRSLKRRG